MTNVNEPKAPDVPVPSPPVPGDPDLSAIQILDALEAWDEISSLLPEEEPVAGIGFATTTNA